MQSKRSKSDIIKSVLSNSFDVEQHIYTCVGQVRDGLIDFLQKCQADFFIFIFLVFLLRIPKYFQLFLHYSLSKYQ